MNASDGWFSFYGTEDFSPSAIDTASWLDAPAGRHGFTRIDGGRIVFEDGTPVRFWGVNICGQRAAQEHADAVVCASRLAKYGVNGVRFHKFTYHGHGIGDADRSTEFDPAQLERFDYLTAELKRRGVYNGWSAIYGHRPRPATATGSSPTTRL